ncbi:hypothetical protein M3Y98_00931700 [Aphelenchoides besseyi]|nr:hypothetical protein M3Y98_00931700 [Aphelenchoides besseyi]KAI6194238.1 hypothetical protein M3Y96_01103600 [Aphelenchoides besseyi]
MNSQTKLRGAHSTPYIRCDDKYVDEKENSNEHLSSNTEIRAVQFNTGCCSSSSSDLSQFTEFYNDHADQAIVEQWAKLYEQRRRTNKSPSANSDTNEFFSDSYGSLSTPKGSTHSVCDTQPSAQTAMQKRSVNRSMDVLPTISEAGFHALEKCVSVEFSPKTYVALSSRLRRSKEMENILFEVAE